jgi:hypothetical protein
VSKLSLKIASAGALLSALAFAAPAHAIPTITCTPATTPNSCTFGNPTAADGANPFTDVYTFTVAYARRVSGTIGSAISGPGTNVNFGTNGVRFFGPGIGAAGEIWSPGVGSGDPELRTITDYVIGAGTYTLSVRGTSQANGAYAGSLTFGGVPEPTTWALMILGFGLVGGALRRRKAVVATRVSFA